MEEYTTPKYKIAVNIIDTLKSYGYNAYIVGGWVRDYLFKISPGNDIDITTSAKPQEIIKIFNKQNKNKSHLVGKSFGVVIINMEGHSFEISTFRQDLESSNGRHPDNVSFVLDPEEDVLRRDFTINALLFDPETESVLDYVGGAMDIKLGILRFVGIPKKRIAEDYLRMLRAVRFATKYKLHIHPDSEAAIKDSVAFVYNLSKERILDELTKILMLPNRSFGIRLMQRLGLLKRILPDIEKMIGMAQPKEHHPEGDVFEHTCLTLDFLGANPSRELLWAALLHDVGKTKTFGMSKDNNPTYYEHDTVGAELAEEILKDLKADAYLIDTVKEMIANHMKFRFAKEMRKSRLARFIYRPTFDEEMKLHMADCLASNNNLENYRHINHMRSQLTKPELPNNMPRVITGNDLIEMGFEPGPKFKTILEGVHDYLIEFGLPLTEESKEEAMNFIKATYQK